MHLKLYWSLTPKSLTRFRIWWLVAANVVSFITEPWMSLSPQLPRTSPTHPVPASLFESENDQCQPENGFRREGSRENCGVSLPEVTYWLCHSGAIEPSVIYLVSLNLNFHKCKIELFYHPYHGSVVHIKWNDKYIALRRESGTENVQQMSTFILFWHMTFQRPWGQCLQWSQWIRMSLISAVSPFCYCCSIKMIGVPQFLYQILFEQDFQG